MEHRFGSRSQSKLNTCHEDLNKIMTLAISRSDIDFGISEGHRTLERQYQLFLEGKSKIDGLDKKGKHNLHPSEAVDIYVYHTNREVQRKLIYDKKHLAYIGGIIQTCAKELLAKGEVTHIIRWGANWDSDGVIDYDQSFDDFPHFELKRI